MVSNILILTMYCAMRTDTAIIACIFRLENFNCNCWFKSWNPGYRNKIILKIIPIDCKKLKNKIASSAFLSIFFLYCLKFFINTIFIWKVNKLNSFLFKLHKKNLNNCIFGNYPTHFIYRTIWRIDRNFLVIMRLMLYILTNKCINISYKGENAKSLWIKWVQPINVFI